MGKPHVSKEEQDRSVRLIKAGMSTYKDEAERHHVRSSTVKAWAEARVQEQPPVPGAAPPPAATASEAPPISTAGGYAGALKSAGLDPEKPAETAEAAKVDLAARKIEDEQFCIEMLGGIKQTIGGLGCQFYFGLDKELPEVRQHLKLGTFAEETVRANASFIAPDLRKWLGQGWALVGVVLAIDAVTSFAILRKMAIAKAAAKDKNKKQEAPVSDPVLASQAV